MSRPRSRAASTRSQNRGSRPCKRLIVCCDGTHTCSIFSYNLSLVLNKLIPEPPHHSQGTWLNSDSGLHNRQLPIPSNVSRLSHAIKTKSGDGISQIVYYQPGIGSSGTIGNRVIGGATGDGLSENIRSGYSYIANNYESGDEIFLFGFSRGGKSSFPHLPLCCC